MSQGTRHLWRRQFDGIMAALRILGCSFPPIRPVSHPTSALLKKACLHKPRGRCRKKPWPSRSCAASRHREALVDSQAIWTTASSVCEFVRMYNEAGCRIREWKPYGWDSKSYSSGHGFSVGYWLSMLRPRGRLFFLWIPFRVCTCVFAG